MVRSLLLLALAAPALPAQTTPHHALQVVHWYNPGAISLPEGDGWQVDFTNVYDDGTRPVVQLSNRKSNVIASVLLFDNYYRKVTPEGCRKDATDGILQHQGEAITNRRETLGKAADGTPLALASWTIHGNPVTNLQRNLFAFASDAQTCYEIHVSKVLAGKPVDAELESALKQFHVRLGYKPDATDNSAMASLLLKTAPMLAAPYYKEALNQTPASGNLDLHRSLTDRLVVALALGGDLKDSRAVAQAAIETDPDYPLNYYNLACADAREGNAAQARVHLEQAFARKQNTLPGEKLPDPTKDDSLLRLQKDADFQAYLQTLHP